MLRNKCTFLLGMLCLSSILAACNSLNNKDSEKKALCRNLKSQQVFGGSKTATNAQGQSWQQRAEEGRLEADYRNYGC